MTETSFARAVFLKDIKERIKDMKYRKFYAVWVIDEIEDGHTVYVLDRQTKKVEAVNEMTVNDAIAVIENAKAHTDRYEFWCDVPEVTKETEENENVEEF